jgi:hypothetical protein
MRIPFRGFSKNALTWPTVILVSFFILLASNSALLGPDTAEARSEQAAIGLDVARERINEAIEIKKGHTEWLMNIPGVVGTGTGIGANGQPVIRVFTMRAGIPGIPEQLEGIPVEKRVTGMFVAYVDPTDRFERPVPIGVSTGHPYITAGTIGCRVRDDLGNVYALSNNHVYANQNEASSGDSALQPGPYDGGEDPADMIGTLWDFEPIDFSVFGTNIMDAAIALSSLGDLDCSTPADGYGTPSSVTELAEIGLKVQKYGRTTGLTHGKIEEIGVTVMVCYADCDDPYLAKYAWFDGQMAIVSRNPTDSFSLGGDSGSLIVTDDGNNHPVGLLFAGSSSRTLANPIDPVLDRFEVTIDDASTTMPVSDVGITAISSPSSVTQGDSADVAVTVSNVGNQNVTSDITVTLLDNTQSAMIGTQTISGGLAASVSTTLNFSWDTGSATLGDHTLTASHDFTDDNDGNDSMSTTVTVTEPSAGVSVSGIYPISMEASTTIDLSISGSGFAAGADVTFENGAGPNPKASNVSVSDSNMITATVTAKSGGPPRDRLWDVRVTNPEGSSGVLVGGFTVTP